MNVTRSILAALAPIFGIAATQAAPLVAPSGQPVAGSTIEPVAKKPKKSARGKACGTYMYRKGRKCMDARAKK